jgi:hypothetical protein
MAWLMSSHKGYTRGRGTFMPLWPSYRKGSSMERNEAAERLREWIPTAENAAGETAPADLDEALATERRIGYGEGWAARADEFSDEDVRAERCFWHGRDTGCSCHAILAHEEAAR